MRLYGEDRFAANWADHVLLQPLINTLDVEVVNTPQPPEIKVVKFMSSHNHTRDSYLPC